jgi:hypothetical protein
VRNMDSQAAPDQLLSELRGLQSATTGSCRKRQRAVSRKPVTFSRAVDSQRAETPLHRCGDSLRIPCRAGASYFLMRNQASSSQPAMKDRPPIGVMAPRFTCLVTASP